MICPPVGTTQDAVVCIPREPPDTYTITDHNGPIVVDTCVDGCANMLCTGSGQFDVIALNTRAVDANASGSIELSSDNSTGRITIVVTYGEQFGTICHSVVSYCLIYLGPTLVNSIPLRIKSGLTLPISGSLIIVDMVFGMMDGPTYRVCKLENGSVLDTTYFATAGRVPQCAEADDGSARADSRPFNIILHSSSELTQEETVTLFLSSSRTCNENATRITEPFNLTVTSKCGIIGIFFL